MDRHGKVIGEKAKIIEDYNTSIANLPALDSAIRALADNADLESVARTRDAQCEKLEEDKENANSNEAENNPGNTTGEGETTTPTTPTPQGPSIEATRECTALRVIPDALPATFNPEALLASLNNIFIKSGTTPESLSPSDTSTNVGVAGINSIPIALSASGNSSLVSTVLNNIEKSIRTFEMGNVTIEWRGSESILLRGQSAAFYSAEKTAELKTKIIKADDSRKTTK